MVTNYYTLRLIADDLNRTLTGSKLTQLFTQQSDELVITCAANSKQYCLVVSCRKSLNYLYLSDAFPRAKKNSVDIFPSLIGARIREVSVHPHDRELFLDTDTAARLAIRPHGSTANVLLLVDSCIQDAFLNRKEQIGTVFGEKHWIREPETAEKLHERLQHSNDLYRSLKTLFPRYGPEVVREMLFLCGLAEDTAPFTLNRQQVELLFHTSRQLETLLVEHAAPRVYFERNVPTTFSIIPLKHLHALRCEEYDSIYTAIRTFIAGSQQQQAFLKHKKVLLQWLRTHREQAERSVARLSQEEKDRAAELKLFGNLLMANLARVNPGMRVIELENLFSPRREKVQIMLDPAQSAARNAERYFERAKALQRHAEERARKREYWMNELTTLQELSERLESVDEPGVYQKFLDRYGDMLVARNFPLNISPKAKEQKTLPFRVFTVAGGFQVWVGKSSENNDLLTMKHAKPNDLWFHARGSSGSHVVLKVGTGKGEPSKLAIQQAAGIAAYYSKMKNAKLVPVAMTLRKYVRKPKGAPAGTVTLEREKTIFAEPTLPHDSGR